MLVTKNYLDLKCFQCIWKRNKVITLFWQRKCEISIYDVTYIYIRFLVIFQSIVPKFALNIAWKLANLNSVFAELSIEATH